MFSVICFFYVSVCLVQSQSVLVKKTVGEDVTLPVSTRSLTVYPSAVWTRGSDEVHQRVQDKDDLRNQYKLFAGRTEMQGALKNGDASLLIKSISLTDAGNYTCKVRDASGEVARVTVELIVTGVKVSTSSISPSVILPFPNRNLSSASDLVWSRGEEEVHHRVGTSDVFTQQSESFAGRTSLTNNMELNLKSPTPSDSGLYQCVLKEGGTELARTTVELTVTERDPDVGSIAGGIVGGVCGVALVILSALTFKRKKHTKESWKDAFTGLMTCKPTAVL